MSPVLETSAPDLSAIEPARSLPGELICDSANPCKSKDSDSDRVSKVSDSDLIRGRIVLHIYRSETAPTYRDIQALLGMASQQAAARHISALQLEGLLQTGRRGLRLTAPGYLVGRYLAAQERSESAFRKQIKRYFGGYFRWAVTAVHVTATAMDREREASPVNGLVRRSPRGGKALARKAAARFILRELKRHPSIELAAPAVGLTPGALDQRVSKLFLRAKRECEDAKCKS